MDRSGRIENKYLVPKSKLSWVRTYLDSYVRNDWHATDQKHGAYNVKSIYYDTRDLRFYHEKLSGIRIRSKVRIRGYNSYSDDANVFLEIKRKNDTTISKNRVIVAYRDILKYMKPGSTCGEIVGNKEIKSRDFQSFLFQMNRYNLGPVVNVIYDREAYYSRIEPGLRITLDRNVHGNVTNSLDQLYVDSHQAYPFPDHFVLEVKTQNPYPRWLNYLVSQLGVRAESVSKYCRCIDQLICNRYPVQSSLNWYQGKLPSDDDQQEFQLINTLAG